MKQWTSTENTIKEEAPLEPVHPSYKLIPKFFDAPTRVGDGIQQIQRMEARKIELQKQANELADFEEVEELWEALEKHVVETTRNNQMLINFSNYMDVIDGLNPKFRDLINVRLFVDLLDESQQRVWIVSIYTHAVCRIILAQERIRLCYYDQVGMGYLRESDMERYIVNMIPSMRQSSFQKFYLCAVVKIVFFFLDTLHAKRVRINRIESSGMLSKIVQLNKKDGRKNWLSMAAIRGVYEEFLRLDKDNNGLLNKSEMAAYGYGLLTPFFLDRAFEVCRSLDGEIDCKTFLEFFLALEHRRTPAGLRYIFRILDIYQQGYLTGETLLYFYNKIQDGHPEAYRFPDLKYKIFDMVKPRDPQKITLRDLVNSRKGNLVVSLLIEFYNNKDPESATDIKYPNSKGQPQRRDTSAVTTLSQI